MLQVVVTLFSGTWRGLTNRKSFPEYHLVREFGMDGRVDRMVVSQVNRTPLRGLASLITRQAGKAELPATTRLHLRLGRPMAGTLSVEESAHWAMRYSRALARMAKRRGLDRPAVVTANPFLAAWGDWDWAGPVVYYAWDDWAAHYKYEGLRDALLDAYEALGARGVGVAAVSRTILDRIQPTGSTHVIANGVDPVEWRDRATAPAWYAELPRPRLLYVGTLDERLDSRLVSEAARAHPRATFVLVGPRTTAPGVSQALRERNVVWHPTVSRREVVGLTISSDGIFIPHADTPLTRSMSPLKLYEGLAGGCRVAVTNLPPVCGVDSRVEVAAGRPFSAAVEAVLTGGRANECERRAFVERHSWRSRFDPLVESLAISAAQGCEVLANKP